MYEFAKLKKIYNIICQELHFALVYHNIEKFSGCLSHLGIFTPNNIFMELTEYSAPQAILSQVFEQKKNNDAFMEDIKSSFCKNEVSLNEVKLILKNISNVSPYDIMNVQMLLYDSTKSINMKAFKKCYPKT